MRWRLGATVLSLVMTFGCSTTSTIWKVQGPPVEGDIVGGSPESIFVDTDVGREYEIPKDDIARIDYPGNVHANIGLGLFIYGALNIFLGLPECRERTEHKTAFCTGVFLPAALGTGLTAWGLLVEHGQKAGTKDTSRQSKLRPSIPFRPAPTAVPVPNATPPSTEGTPSPAETPSPSIAPAP